MSIVDDDLSVRESLKMLFESAEFDAEIFASAEEFLSAGHLGESACLVLDVQLPGISGIELQNRLRADGNNISRYFHYCPSRRTHSRVSNARRRNPLFFETIQRQGPPQGGSDSSITPHLRRLSVAAASWLLRKTPISLK